MCSMSSDISSPVQKLIKSTSQSLKHVLLLLQVESTLLTNQCRGQLKLTGSNKNGRPFNSSVFFFCLPSLMHKFRTQCDGSEEKQVILTLGAWTHHLTGHHFLYPGDARLKWRINIQLTTKALCSMSMRCDRRKTKPWPTAGCHNQGLQSLLHNHTQK